MFSRIYHLFKGPSPLHPAVWKGRLSPMKFRRFQPSDSARCLELYAINERGRFPEGYIDEYRKHLDAQTSYYLLGELNGHTVATGAVAYLFRENAVVLSFGLVDPDYQNRGLGTSLLLARLALLKPNRRSYDVFIFGVEKAFNFYRRFGFQCIQPWKDPNGKLRPSGLLCMAASDAPRCRQLLEAHNITIPHDENEIPLITRSTK